MEMIMNQFWEIEEEIGEKEVGEMGVRGVDGFFQSLAGVGMQLFGDESDGGEFFGGMDKQLQDDSPLQSPKTITLTQIPSSPPNNPCSQCFPPTLPSSPLLREDSSSFPLELQLPLLLPIPVGVPLHQQQNPSAQPQKPKKKVDKKKDYYMKKNYLARVFQIISDIIQDQYGIESEVWRIFKQTKKNEEQFRKLMEVDQIRKVIVMLMRNDAYKRDFQMAKIHEVEIKLLMSFKTRKLFIKNMQGFIAKRTEPKILLSSLRKEDIL